MKILEFAIKGTEDYSKAQDKEMEDFGKIENLLTETISNIESGNTNSNPSEPEDPYSNYIGKYVNYVPMGTNYTAEAKYSGHTETQTFTQDTNLKWKIWKVENDTLYLISEGEPSTSGYNNTGNLRLKGAQGYNNGVTLIDNICSNNYGISGNSSVKARNIKLEDIIESCNNEQLSFYNSIYGENVDSCTGIFPYIFEKYGLTKEDVKENSSRAYPLVELEESIGESKTLDVVWSFVCNESMNKESAWNSYEIYDMIMGPAQTRSYWISTRNAYYLGSEYLGLYYINETGLDGVSKHEVLFDNNGSAVHHTKTCGIRPIIQIPLSACEITPNATETNTFDIVIK